MMHFIISGNIRKEIRNIMSFTELKKLHWLLSNGHFSVISERALVYIWLPVTSYLKISINSIISIWPPENFIFFPLKIA